MIEQGEFDIENRIVATKQISQDTTDDFGE